VEVRRIVLTKGTVRYADAMTHVDASANIDTINDARYGVAWQLHGKWNARLQRQRQGRRRAVAAAAGHAVPAGGPARCRRHQHQHRRHADQAGRTGGAGLRLKLSGPSMARLYALTGVLLPETPPFATEGHLTGKLGAHGSWLYDQFTGTVGRSDIGGKLAFKTGRRVRC
jgi:hypothetical protein